MGKGGRVVGNTLYDSDMQATKRVFSAIQPTGQLHLGNYLGALRNWPELAKDNDALFCVVDLHALTIPEAITPNEMRNAVLQTAAAIIASGIDPARSPVFIQSSVPAHSELAWIITCLTPMGWLSKMTQFKSKAGGESVGAGLFTYPTLMAADILLYDTDLVPVGDDQDQHVQLCRDVAGRFNSQFGETFVMPQALLPKHAARVMGLDDPGVKMSKSLVANRPLHAILLTDTPEVIQRKIKRAVTDGVAVTDAGVVKTGETNFATASPGVRNLLEIYAALTNSTPGSSDAHFANRGYGFLKEEVANVVIESLRPVREEMLALLQAPDELTKVLTAGAEVANARALKKMEVVHTLLGLR